MPERDYTSETSELIKKLKEVLKKLSPEQRRA
jgi:hypothetical protein